MSDLNKFELQTITTNELSEKLKGRGRFRFWNVLTDEYYGGRNIAGSIRVPLDEIGRYVRDEKIAVDDEIVVYCTGPECPQSSFAAEKLKTLGYSNVVVYKGGLEEWYAARLPIFSDLTEKAAA